MEKVVLVTGGSGLVGKAIEDKVLNDSYFREYKFVFSTSEDANLADLDETRSLFRKHQPMFVLNLAARVGGLFANMKDNETFYQINSKINSNVLLCSSELKVEKCISCLSTCVFPDNIEYPFDETKIHLGPPHQSNSGYSLAKREVDLLNHHYNEINAGSSLFTAVIPTNIYGSFDNFNLENSHIVPGLIHKAYKSILEARSRNQAEATITVYGSGEPLRQFIYAPDLAELILWCLKNYSDPEPLILSPDEIDEVNISHVATLICKAFERRFNMKITIRYDNTFSDGQYRKTASNRKLRNLNPIFVFTPLTIGIQKTVDWFCNNYSNARK